VVAIIAILAAIAVPNFLEAQTSAKVSRAKADLRSLAVALEAYASDELKVPPDGNDPGIPQMTFEQETGIPSDMIPPPTGHTAYTRGLLRTYRRWSPLTTPIAYITSIPIDSFSRVMPYEYETWILGGELRFCLVGSMGPDRDRDSGYGGINSMYDPTNGTLSNGDMYRPAFVTDTMWLYNRFGITWKPYD